MSRVSRYDRTLTLPATWLGMERSAHGWEDQLVDQDLLELKALRLALLLRHLLPTCADPRPTVLRLIVHCILT